MTDQEFTAMLADRRPDPHYPECDLDDSGPQRGVWWADHQFEGTTLSAATIRGNRYVLPNRVYDRLRGGKEYKPHPTLVGRHRVYGTEAEAMADFRQAVAVVEGGGA